MSDVTYAVYEFVIFARPLPKEVKEGKPGEIVAEGKCCVPDTKAAEMFAHSQIPADWQKDLHRLEVAVRPFCED